MINTENISFDHCIKCTVCAIYCPVAKVTHLFPGPKHSGPDAERLRIKNPHLVDASLKYCTNCKRCEIACPSDVKIADIIHLAKWTYLKKKLFRFRDFFISRTDFVGFWATSFSFLVNFFLGLGVVKFFMDIILKIPRKKTLPRYESGTFQAWFDKTQDRQRKFSARVAYFHGCFVNYNNHQLGRDLIKVLNSMNIGVALTPEKCCGVPLIANGYLKAAIKNAKFNIASLEKVKGKIRGKIVSTSSSCTFALTHEYANLLGLDNSAIYSEVEYITKFLMDQFEMGNVPDMNPLKMKVAYHSPCHLERMGGVRYTIGILKRIPGLELIILNSECCGISGTYGFKKEYFQISQDVGSQLFKMIEMVNPDYVVTDCETCALQIEMNTPCKVLHPVSLLAKALMEL